MGSVQSPCPPLPPSLPSSWFWVADLWVSLGNSDRQILQCSYMILPNYTQETEWRLGAGRSVHWIHCCWGSYFLHKRQKWACLRTNFCGIIRVIFILKFVDDKESTKFAMKKAYSIIIQIKVVYPNEKHSVLMKPAVFPISYSFCLPINCNLS